MAKMLTLQASARAGKSTAIRRQDKLPAVLYGHGVDNQALTLDTKAFTKIYHQAGHTSLVNLTVASDTTEHPVLIKEVQLEPVRGGMLHIDLYQVDMNKKIHAQVPLTFVGEAPAVKDLGGVLVRNLGAVELEALPLDLPHDIEIDISSMSEFDTPIRIKELNVSDKVEILHESDQVIALVQPPRTEEELEADLAEEVTEDVESVEGVEDKPAEGEEGEEDEGEEKPADKEKPAESSEKSSE